MPLRFSNFDGTENIRFVPASLPANKATLEWEPNFTKDGVYALLVQAKDKSANASGAIDYEIEFEAEIEIEFEIETLQLMFFILT